MELWMISRSKFGCFLEIHQTVTLMSCQIFPPTKCHVAGNTITLAQLSIIGHKLHFDLWNLCILVCLDHSETKWSQYWLNGVKFGELAKKSIQQKASHYWWKEIKFCKTSYIHFLNSPNINPTISIIHSISLSIKLTIISPKYCNHLFFHVRLIE